jgi:hypothetical protein
MYPKLRNQRGTRNLPVHPELNKKATIVTLQSSFNKDKSMVSSTKKQKIDIYIRLQITSV